MHYSSRCITQAAKYCAAVGLAQNGHLLVQDCCAGQTLKAKKVMVKISHVFDCWCARRESNPRPLASETNTLSS
jgi:hypothetical protein